MEMSDTTQEIIKGQTERKEDRKGGGTEGISVPLGSGWKDDTLIER